jgi:hypothetical protein
VNKAEGIYGKPSATLWELQKDNRETDKELFQRNIN